MRLRFLTFTILGFAFFLPSCGSREEPTDTGVVAVAPDPANVEVHATLKPNADLTPQQWTAQPSGQARYQAIDEIYPLDGNSIYAMYNYASRFGLTNLGYTSATVTALQVSVNASYSLHQGDAVVLTVFLYAGGELLQAPGFTYCTEENPLYGCTVVGEPEGDWLWEFGVYNLELSMSQVNSLEVVVDAYFMDDHGPELLHSVRIQNLYVDAAVQVDKDPDPDPEQP